MAFKKTYLLLSLCIFLVACSSNPTVSFYQLKFIDTENNNLAVPNTKNLTILIHSVKFPEYLDQPQIVIRESAYKLKLSENQYWAEPLENEFTRVFTENLNSRITPNHAVKYSELHGDKADIHLSIKVLQLDVNLEGEATLSVKWAYWPEGNIQNITRLKNTYQVPIKYNNYESKVEAQSQAIAIFSRAVAETLTK